jgi:hypothetical protein
MDETPMKEQKREENMAKKNGFGWLGWGLVAGGVAGVIAARRMAARRHMPYLDTWQRAMARKRGEVKAAMVATRVEKRFDELYAGRPRFTHRALRNHLENNILPGLALYQILLEEGEDQEATLAEVEQMFEISFGQIRKGMPLLDRVPNTFDLFRWLTRWSLKNQFSPGWEIEWVEDSEQSIAFNMHSCFYLNVLTAYGAPELTRVYCQMDDLLYEALPPSIAWQRTKTLGRGDDCCDFCWSRGTESMSKEEVNL